MRHALGATLEYWPTIVALAILAFVELRAAPWSLISKQAIWVGLSCWIGTFAVYAIREQEYTVPRVIVFMVWTGFPIVLMLAGLTAIRRLTRRPAAQSIVEHSLMSRCWDYWCPSGSCSPAGSPAIASSRVAAINR